MSGFVKVHRGWSQSDVFRDSEPFCSRAAWIWLIEHAAWKECIRHDNHGNMITVERGQIHTSTRALGQAWGWSKNRVQRFLTRLQKCQNLDHKTDQHGTLITICNYNKYQTSPDDDGPANGPATDQQRTTQEERKEGKEDIITGGYAFEGRVIKLKEADFRRWESAYNLVDIRAALQSRDDWIDGQPSEHRKRWFQSTSNYLARLQQEAAAVERNADVRFC